ncbi:zinc finger domain-containing protein [Streptomyces syringium]|uniref:zinc finger domain-containing protein n=1 Tax=Streptomyces syringium TaxID=76729 RepID=UPI0033C93366
MRDWFRRVECPTCKAGAGRACRTSNGHPTNHHRARRDVAGPIPYEQWKKQGLWSEPKRFTMPAVLREAQKARTDYNVDLALGDGVAVVRIFLAERLGIALEDEATLDRVDDAVRLLLQVRGPEKSADLVTVLASFIAAILSTTAGPDGDPEALFDSLITAHVNEAKRLRTIDRNRSHD